MQEFQWSGSAIILLTMAVIALVAVGLWAAARYRQEFTRMTASNSELAEQLHQQEVEKSRLQQQVSHAQETEARLDAEAAERKAALTAVQLTLEQTRQQQHSAEKLLQAAQADNRALKEQESDLRRRLDQAESSAQQERERYQTLDHHHTELKTTLEQKEAHFKEQMQQLNESRQSLTKEFENLANKIFEEKGKTFTQTSQTSIDTLLKPFREQIESFQKRVNEVHESSLKENSSLNAEIKKVLDIGLKMSNEANNLTSALKGDSQQRGAWGEAQLRRTLEMSGLVEDAHYAVQSAFKDAEGKLKQTDYLIKLPDGKHLVIDSKVALNAYDRVVAAELPDEHQQAIGEHIKAVRKHIDELAAKDYTTLPGMHSPSFVLMFMPVEPAYIEALKNSRDLFEYGYKKGVVLVSHTTLIPILRTIANLWMIERSNAEAREISEKAGDIYNQVCLIADRLSKLGHTLNTASGHYNSTVTALTGQQGLYGKVNRFSQLSAKVSKTLPQLEPRHMDFETGRLSMIVEAIPEEPEELTE